MKQTPQLIVVTLLPPQGPTGVQTHFNQILKAADSRGYQTRIVHPYDFYWFARKSVGLINRLLRHINVESTHLWARWAHYHFLKHKLSRILATEKGKIILYAQDPLSAKAALTARTDQNQRVATVIHYNISEAAECLLKGITTENGYLYNHMVNNEKATLPRVDKLFFVAQFMRSIVETRLPKTQEIPSVVIPNFIEDQIGINPTPSHNGDILSVGTLEPRKNQAFLLKVLAKCNVLGHVYRLTIIGDGQDRKMLEQLSQDLGLTEQVTFLGFKPNAADYMASHRVLAHSAIIETMGIALVEALSHSLPLLAVPVGGIPEVFADSREGFYWQLDDIEGAADKLCELLENTALYEQISKNARSRFIQHFSKQTLANKWLDELIAS